VIFGGADPFSALTSAGATSPTMLRFYTLIIETEWQFSASNWFEQGRLRLLWELAARFVHSEADAF
jgi:hypothetical protein